ncbi:MAG TPA: hypothetical protein VNA25_16430 [Phycisphaerae bacterium]|nr:hypothetical protein [Phycisphaerae bacterium]
MTEDELLLPDDEPQDEDMEPDAPDVESEATGAEPETPEPESTVPSLVAKYSPGMAGVWKDLSAEQQTVFLGDIAARLDTQQAEDTKPNTEDKGGVGAAELQPGEGVSRPSVLSFPDPLSQDERNILIEAVGGEDSPEGRVMKRFLDSGDQWGKVWDHTTQLVKGALDDQDVRLSSVERERRLEQSLVDHGGEMKGFSQADIESVAQGAEELVKSGRVKEYGDAVSLALMQTGKKAQPGNQAGAQRRSATLAANATRSTRATSNRTVPVPKDFDEALEQARVEVGG